MEVRIVVSKGRVKEILDRLEAARSEIAVCYSELTKLGVLTITEDVE